MLIGLRKGLRRAVPEAWRRQLARLRRVACDQLDGTRAKLAIERSGAVDWPCVVVVEQPIRTSPMWQGKLANLQLGSALLDGVRIAPGQVFSFWALAGQPTEARGFAIGRAIRADVARGDTGGGLCQLSGIAYELGLRGGLTVVERHAHSRDLYEREEDRFTPLGLDATVVWPWKDLRLENRLGVPVMLRFTVEGMVLKAGLLAGSEISTLPLELGRTDHADHREVIVQRGGKLVSLDRYVI